MRRIQRKGISVALVACFLFFIAACDSGADAVTDIPTGTYAEFGVRQLRDGNVVSEGLAGVYFQRAFQFNADGTFEINVASDHGPENGIARGRYEVGDGLRFKIESSTTTYYSVGSVVTYDDMELIDETYRTRFDIDGGNLEFRGPGLVLSAEQEDTDNHVDVTETYLRGPIAGL